MQIYGSLILLIEPFIESWIFQDESAIRIKKWFLF